MQRESSTPSLGLVFWGFWGAILMAAVGWIVVAIMQHKGFALCVGLGIACGALAELRQPRLFMTPGEMYQNLKAGKLKRSFLVRTLDGLGFGFFIAAAVLLFR